MLNHDLVSLTPAFQLLAGIGGCACVFLMQLTHYEAEDKVDPPWIRNVRRLSLMLLALSLCWAAYYSTTLKWEPWPPVVGMVAALDMLIGIRIFAIRARVRRTGPYIQSQRQVDIMRAARDKRASGR